MNPSRNACARMRNVPLSNARGFAEPFFRIPRYDHQELPNDPGGTVGSGYGAKAAYESCGRKPYATCLKAGRSKVVSIVAGADGSDRLRGLGSGRSRFAGRSLHSADDDRRRGICGPFETLLLASCVRVPASLVRHAGSGCRSDPEVRVRIAGVLRFRSVCRSLWCATEDWRWITSQDSSGSRTCAAKPRNS